MSCSMKIFDYSTKMIIQQQVCPALQMNFDCAQLLLQEAHACKPERTRYKGCVCTRASKSAHRHQYTLTLRNTEQTPHQDVHVHTDTQALIHNLTTHANLQFDTLHKDVSAANIPCSRSILETQMLSQSHTKSRPTTTPYIHTVFVSTRTPYTWIKAFTWNPLDLAHAQWNLPPKKHHPNPCLSLCV